MKPNIVHFSVVVHGTKTEGDIDIKQLYPIKMNPAFKDYLWGGNKLINEWGKASPYSITAESWELSAHPNGRSIAANGPWSGYSLNDIVETLGQDCIGEKTGYKGRFPIIVKLIDSKQNLSIQVHPDDDYAMRMEGDHGKTEMWYVAQADAGSGIFCGFKADISKEEYQHRIYNDTLSNVLNFISVKKGDVFFIPPGTVHAICGGTVIAEIQQSSDITYRVYDYNRVGTDGKPRELHVEKALDVSILKAMHFDGKRASTPIVLNGYKKTLLSSCHYFTVSELEIGHHCELNATKESFQSITFLDGAGSIRWGMNQEKFKKGDTFFIPANMGEYFIEGPSLALLTSL